MVLINHLVVCEIFNKYIHGYDEDSYDVVKDHYLCMHVSRNRSIFDSRDYNEEDTDDSYECHILDVVDLHGSYYMSYAAQRNKNTQHPFIRNYKRIISKDSYIQPHIASVIYLPSGECVAIIKTFWLRLVQRAWKRVFQERKRVSKKRMMQSSLRHREIHGVWPKDCRYFPLLHGMLSTTATA
jgi:hypothetical protein